MVKGSELCVNVPQKGNSGGRLPVHAGPKEATQGREGNGCIHLAWVASFLLLIHMAVVSGLWKALLSPALL